MSLRTLPEAKTFARPKNFQADAPSDALARWAELPLAAAEGEGVINIMEVIGEDWWSGGGMTANRMAGLLRSIGPKDLVVNVNSPGGDMFEGIAIYNQLRAHKARVTVNVLGLAASAASIIAMAADEIRMGLGSNLMIHNAWGVVIGNRHDLAQASDTFAQFDAGLADIYEARTGVDRAEIEKLMDAETFMTATNAVELGFADAVADDLPVGDGPDNKMNDSIRAKRRLEAALAKDGLSRSDRQSVIAAAMDRNAGGPRDATPDFAARDAGTLAASLAKLTETLRN